MPRQKPRSLIYILVPVISIFLIFQLTGLLFAKTQNQLIRVGLASGMDKLSFSVNGDFQIINKNSGVIIDSPKPGEHWEAVLEGSQTKLLKDGKAIGTFKDPVTVKVAKDAKPPSSNTPALVTLDVKNVPKTYRGEMEFKLAEDKLQVVNVLPVEDYLLAVVPSEMPDKFGLEALKAQALAARTYALKANEYTAGKDYQLSPTDASQVYGGYGAETPLSTKAVQETSGEVITYQNKLIDAVFFSCSGGFTDNCEDVWKNSFPYLKWKQDPYDKNDKYYNWVVNFTTDQLTAQVNQGLAKLGYPDKFKQVEELQELSHTSSGARVKELAIIGTGLNDSKINVKLSNADRVRIALGLKSSLFKIEQKKESQGKVSGYKITGSGWGHGLGMSQYGAKGMADQGYKYKQILEYYYSGIEIKPNYGK